MRFQGALLREQNVEFAVVVVKPHVIADHPEADRLARTFSGIFGMRPVVLMAQDHNGRIAVAPTRIAGCSIPAACRKALALGTSA